MQRQTPRAPELEGDPLFHVHRLLLVGAERLDQRGWESVHTVLDAAEPADQVQHARVAKEKVRAVCATEDSDTATAVVDDAIDWCIAPYAGRK